MTRELTMAEEFDPTRRDVNAEDPKDAITTDKEMHERLEKRAGRYVSRVSDATELDPNGVGVFFFIRQRKIRRNAKPQVARERQ
jgi:hypothetical protein